MRDEIRGTFAELNGDGSDHDSLVSDSLHRINTIHSDSPFP